MKHKKYLLFLLLEAAGVIGITKGMGVKVESVFDLLSFPLVKFADFLGTLSLSGGVGNAVAIIIYALVCLVPVFVMLSKMKQNNFKKTDSLLVLMSAALFAVIYLLINPSEMGLRSEIDGASQIVAFSFWSLFFGYIILKFTEKISETEGDKILKLLSGVIKVIGAVFMFAICTVKITATEIGFMTVLGFVNTAVPYVFALVTVFLSLELSGEFTSDRYSENTVKVAEKLSSFCMLSVKVSVVVSALYNVLQLRYINELSNVDFKLQVPLFSLGFILLVLVMTGFIKDSKALKEDNDSFI